MLHVRRAHQLFLSSCAAALGALLLASTWVAVRHSGRIFNVETAPRARYALVFGAGLLPARAPSPMLAERLDTALALYQRGKVQRILISGDSIGPYHRETAVMKRYLLDRKLPEEHLMEDPAGLSTYASCYRAARRFEVQDALLVTQRFHVDRAVFLARALGMNAHGVAPDPSRRPSWGSWLREHVSRAWALYLALRQPVPTHDG